MHTRFVAAGLWLFASLYAGSMLHAIAGVPELVGPGFGLMTAAGILLRPTVRGVTSPAARLAHEANSLDLAADPA